MELTEEQKKSMPATRQKNSLLAVGKNLAQLPDRDEAGESGRGGPTFVRGKRGRSLSGEQCYNVVDTAGGDAKQLMRTRSVGRGELGVTTSLLELGQVCQREREKIQDSQTQVPPEQTPMKPPTPVRFNHLYALRYRHLYLKDSFE